MKSSTLRSDVDLVVTLLLISCLIIFQCYPAPNVRCNGKVFDGITPGFWKYERCLFKNGTRRFDIALLCSVFLGIIGVDRFYLGYPALGLIKLSSFGGLLVWWLLDIVLIATQTIGPSDQSGYAMLSYGPYQIKLAVANSTFREIIHSEL